MTVWIAASLLLMQYVVPASYFLRLHEGALLLYRGDVAPPLPGTECCVWMPETPVLLPRMYRGPTPWTAPPRHTTALTLPLWPLPVAFGTLAWYAGRRIKRLQRHGCAKCGYDTRGLAAGACCPECGTACSV